MGKFLKRFNGRSDRNVYKELQSVGNDKNARFRDVYNTQQVKRSELSKVKTKTPRLYASLVISFLLMIAIYYFTANISASMFKMSNALSIKKYELALEGVNNDNIIENGRFIDYEGNEYKYAIEENGSYYPVDEEGNINSEQSYMGISEIEIPEWFQKLYESKMADKEKYISDGFTKDVMIRNINNYLGKADTMYRVMHPNLRFIFLLLVLYGISSLAIYFLLIMNLKSENLLADTGELNQYTNDQHIQTPLELLENQNFDLAPDAGAHHNHMVASIIAHVNFNNDGVKEIDGVPFFDYEFGEKLFDSAEVIPERRIYFSPNKIKYNPKNESRVRRTNDEKPYDTVADLINAEWDMPDYEPQLPAGAYVVDTNPVNTLLVAMTRAGKGQTYLEALIDLKSRQRVKKNLVINDPKGELLLKNYDRLTARGYIIMQFNLQIPMKTNIYNPLGLVADSVKDGDVSSGNESLNSISDVFFPVKGADDPMWPTAAANAFKRASYALIDFYNEEEIEMRKIARLQGWSAKKLDRELNLMWSKVTMYNAYQYFVALSSKKIKNPLAKVKEQNEAYQKGEGDWVGKSEEEIKSIIANANLENEHIFQSQPEIDMLTAYARATALLPKNEIRTLMLDAHSVLNAMGGSEKTISSVYGIAITAMSYFADPTIIRLTSGPPDENFDVSALAFPRMFGFRLNKDYMRNNKLLGLGIKFTAYEDAEFSKPMSDKFNHVDTVNETGWCNCFFEGILPNEVAYYKAQLFNRRTGYAVKSFYFKITKKYMTTLTGGSYYLDPVLNDRIVKNLIVEEIVKTKDGYVSAVSMFDVDSVIWDNDLGECVKAKTKSSIISQTRNSYIEKPMGVFLVTPPDKVKYAKLLLIFISQCVNAVFKYTYVTKESQKPIVGTDYIIDEAGNLQSEGQGIYNLTTLVSIGLAQELQFTLVFQTMQQIKDVYGDTSDKTIQGNTSNIIYIKSTDNSLIEEFVKMTGIVHMVRKNSRNVTENLNNPLMKNAMSVSTTIQASEETVLTYNDFAFIPKSNMIVISAGQSVIWCRNEMAMPYAYAIHSQLPKYTDEKYSMQTCPTISNAMYFDVNTSMPNFYEMYEKRMKQAMASTIIIDKYKSISGLSDFQILQKDKNIYSDEVMDLINQKLRFIGELPKIEMVDDPDVFKVSMEQEALGKKRANPARFDGIIPFGGLIDETGISKFNNIYFNELMRMFIENYLEDLLETDLFEPNDFIGLSAKEEVRYGKRVVKKGEKLCGNSDIEETDSIDFKIKPAFWYYIFGIENFDERVGDKCIDDLRAVVDELKMLSEE